MAKAKLTFMGGVHPYDGKDLSKDKPIKTVLPKGDLVYPLSQHIGAPARPIVKKGDHVLTGRGGWLHVGACLQQRLRHREGH